MPTKADKIKNFNPSDPGLADASIYGLPFDANESELIILPVPWEVTVSYGSGAAKGPQAVFDASFQVDLLHQEFPDLWKLGIFMDTPPNDWQNKSQQLKELANSIIEALEKGETVESNAQLSQNLATINKASAQLNQEVTARTEYWQKQGKRVILLGGDHSTPLGYYQALAQQYQDFGILHLDAHMDLRKAYEGFEHSHASIMYNATQIEQLSKIVQVGIRDFSETEVDYVKSTDKVVVFTDADIKNSLFEGKTWQNICDKIINSLPKNVVISFDIDALQQWYCPNTGTPVPGGLSYEQAIYLLNRLANSEKNIIGADLVEVSPGEDEWDGNVGTRLLYHLCGVFAKNNGLETGDRLRL